MTTNPPSELDSTKRALALYWGWLTLLEQALGTAAFRVPDVKAILYGGWTLIPYGPGDYSVLSHYQDRPSDPSTSALRSSRIVKATRIPPSDSCADPVLDPCGGWILKTNSGSTYVLIGECMSEHLAKTHKDFLSSIS
jgi:hypothetical protein